MKRRCTWCMLAWLFVALAGPWLGVAKAASEEIVIFDDELPKPGTIDYEMHLNYAARARRDPDYPGEMPPEGVLRLMPELSFGLSDTWGMGLHLPISHKSGKTYVDGLKVRGTNVTKRQTEWGSWFYGANYELSYFDKRLSDSRLIAEVLGILGMRRGDWLFLINPVLGRSLSSNTSELDKSLGLDINYKAMKSFGDRLAIGFEHYSQVGKAHRPDFGASSAQVTYAIVEFVTKSHFDFRIGIGRGWTDPADKLVYKMIVGIPF